MSDREEFVSRLKADKETQENIDRKYDEIREKYNPDGTLKKETSEESEDSSDSTDDFDDMSNDLREKEAEGSDTGRERSQELSKETDDGEQVR